MINWRDEKLARILRATEVRVPCRLSFAHVLEEDKFGAYSCTLLIPKTDTGTVEKLNNAIEAALQAGRTKLLNKEGTINRKKLSLPLHDADEEENTNNGYKGMMFFSAKNKRRPQCVNRRLEIIEDEEEIYSGCYCNVMINFYAYDFQGKKGIAASLGNIQKIRDGEHLGYGRSQADEDFDNEDGSEDFDL